METLKPIIPFRGRAALLATAFMVTPLAAGEPRPASSVAATEVARRSAAIEEAQILLRKGDEAYESARYADAVEAYAGARSLIPNVPVSAALHAAATQRFSQASVEHARVLSRKGDVAAAKAAVDRVLDPSIAPNDPDALAFRAQLDDPIRTNPALTKEHAKDVDQVRRLLYTAEGAFNLGKFDEAHHSYQDVLRIDPTNSAARRGLEQVASAKSNYYKSSSDQTRAEMLSQVDAAWETQVAPALDAPSIEPDTGPNDSSSISVANKIDRIIIPKVALDQVTLEEALDFLRLRSAENDTLELDPSRKGVNFTLNLGPPDSPASQSVRTLRFDLRLNEVPVSQILRYITDMTRTSFTTDDFAVIIKPLGATSDEIVTRTYRVTPDFISNLSNQAAGGETAAAADPFAASPAAGNGLLTVRMSAQEALAKQGVSFPEGASASYLPATNTLRVVNTPANQEYISQIVETISQTEPVMIAVRVTMIKVEETHLQELGFDWLLDNFGFAGDSWVPGTDKLNLTGGTTGNGGDLGDIQLPDGAFIRNPITAGNRSGDGAINGNSIDDLITNPQGRQTNNRAPGVIGVNGTLNNSNIQMLMRGLDQKKGVDVMARPSVTTRSGQSSSIQVVREFMYATEYEPPELPNQVGGGQTVLIGPGGDIIGGGGGASTFPVTPATPTAFEKKDVGITLEVLPVADANKRYIDLTLNPTFTEFDGFVNYGSPINTTSNGLTGPVTVALTQNEILMPVFSRKTVNTQVRVADGATVVLGGLMQERVQNVEDKTPVLGSIPIVGRLFQSKARQPVSMAVVFLVNVELMDPTGTRYRNN